MPRLPRPLARSLAPVVAVLAVLLVLAPAGGTARAHNSFETSDPADGATLAVAPAQISMTFSASVPLESASVQVIDSTGVRTQAQLSHGPSGDRELVAALPAVAPGEVTVRWRLVGPDGHPLTDRIRFTVSAPTATSVAPVPGVAAPTSTPPTVGGESVAEPLAAGEPYSTPSFVRWLLRYGSYVAIMLVLGIVLTDRFVWNGAAQVPVLRRVVDRSLVAVGVLAFVQLLVLASDIVGRAPWSVIGDLDAALRTDAGVALLARIALVVAAWAVLHGMRFSSPDVRWNALGIAGVGLMATWAFAGHAASQRWPEVGVPLSVVHHTAAATWVGALAVVGVVAARRLSADELAAVAPRLSSTAAIAVRVVVATGIAQGIRLVGNPSGLWEGSHGRYLLVKLVVLAVMLAVADANRRRVARDLAAPHDGRGARTATAVGRVRQAVAVELVLGLVIIGITAALVVEPPATSSDAAAAVGATYYYTV